jgi:hypothetical protein
VHLEQQVREILLQQVLLKDNLVQLIQTILVLTEDQVVEEQQLQVLKVLVEMLEMEELEQHLLLMKHLQGELVVVEVAEEIQDLFQQIKVLVEVMEEQHLILMELPIKVVVVVELMPIRLQVVLVDLV